MGVNLKIINGINFQIINSLFDEKLNVKECEKDIIQKYNQEIETKRNHPLHSFPFFWYPLSVELTRELSSPYFDDIRDHINYACSIEEIKKSLDPESTNLVITGGYMANNFEKYYEYHKEGKEIEEKRKTAVGEELEKLDQQNIQMANVIYDYIFDPYTELEVQSNLILCSLSLTKDPTKDPNRELFSNSASDTPFMRMKYQNMDVSRQLSLFDFNDVIYSCVKHSDNLGDLNFEGQLTDELNSVLGNVRC
ncbi:hypothetical protein ACFL1H_04105 [Nanoarchaeota archaeon]